MLSGIVDNLLDRATPGELVHFFRIQAGHVVVNNLARRNENIGLGCGFDLSVNKVLLKMKRYLQISQNRYRFKQKPLRRVTYRRKARIGHVSVVSGRHYNIARVGQRRSTCAAFVLVHVRTAPEHKHARCVRLVLTH